jgi:hypothetical protein
MSRRTLVAANEDVLLELWHGVLVRDSIQHSTLEAILNLPSSLDFNLPGSFDLTRTPGRPVFSSARALPFVASAR